MHRSRRSPHRRLLVGAALAGSLAPALLGAAPASANTTAIVDWYAYHAESAPAPYYYKCALGRAQATIYVAMPYGGFPVATAWTSSRYGGFCAGGGYSPGPGTVTAQAALIYWNQGSATLCAMDGPTTNWTEYEIVDGAAGDCGAGQYSSTTFHNVKINGVDNTAMLVTGTIDY